MPTLTITNLNEHHKSGSIILYVVNKNAGEKCCSLGLIVRIGMSEFRSFDLIIPSFRTNESLCFVFDLIFAQDA